MIVLLILIYLDLLFGSTGENIDLDLHVDRENWLDPNDPFSSSLFCTKNTLDQLAVCQANLKGCLKGSKKTAQEISVESHAEDHYIHDLTLKHVVRNFLHRMDVDIDKTKRVDRIVEVYLDGDSLAVLKKYLNSKDETITVREQVREVLERMIVPVNIAARMSRAEKSIAEKCKANNFFSTAMNMVSGLFVFKGEDECEQHYKDLYVNPIYEISLLDVICEVLSNFIFTSLGVFGRHFNIFLNEFLRDSPLHFIVVKTITLFFLIVLLLFWLGSYRIRTFMATIEPAGTTHTMSQVLQTVDHWSNEERPKIDTSKSTILRVGLKPIRNTVSSNRRRSLSTSRLTSSCLSHRYPRRELIGSIAVAVANSSLHHITNTARSQL
uniref:Chloride channel CLIC-like protein 1 n=1 Tax=Wuchereria bancrofti TaxID=6293 RepID=A0A1I8ETE7_WUCBA